MSEPQTYSGGCHCGQVRYRAAASLGQVIACNCSICSKHGLLLTFVGGTDFELVSGQHSLKDYQFGTKRIQHLFCTACGVESFARGTAPDGSEMVAVNVRCLDGVELATLTPTPFDGKSL
jgi:hypothetical protein